MLLKADIIRGKRLQQGWTQEQLAELCGISVRTVQRLEKTGVASLETTNALAAVFAVERVVLLDDGTTEPPRDGELEPSITAIHPHHLWLAAGSTFLLGLLLGQWL